jgi:hypothetical protein
MNISEIAIKIITNPEFQKLQEIGGGQEYHQEGSAFVHSLLVFHNSFEFWGNTPMNIIALLHDIGKIYTGRPKENGDWEYPYHAKVGADKLELFWPKELGKAWFDNAQWFIGHHIKPLFWVDYPEFCIENVELAKLAICDLKGSYSKKPQKDKIANLYKFIEEYRQRKFNELD